MRRWAAVVVLGSAQFVMVLDSTVMNVSVSEVIRDLRMTVPDMQLAIAAYTLVMAAFMLTGAALADRWGRRRVLVVGLCLFASGALVTALAPNFAVLLIGWSGLEGLGSALVIPAIAALVAANYTGRRRAVAYGITGGIAGAGAAAGPIVGGWVTTALSWRVVFGAEVVLVVLLVGAVRLVADGPRSEVAGRFDVVGALSSAVGLGVVVLALARSTEWGWVVARRPPFTVLGFSPTLVFVVAGAVLGTAFVRWEERRAARGEVALLDVRLLRVPPVRAGLSTLAVQQFVLGGAFFVLPLYLQLVVGLDALGAGLRVVPLSVAVFCSSFVGARAASRTSPRTLIRLGLVTTVVGVAGLLGTVDRELRAGEFGLAMALFGAGIGLVASQIGNVLQSSVDPARSSEVGGLQGTAQNLGSSLGTAIVGAVLLGGLAAGFSARLAADPRVSSSLAAAVDARTEQGVEFVAIADARAAAARAGLSAADAGEVVTAYGEAQLGALKAALGAIALVGTAGMWFTRRLPASRLVAGPPGGGVQRRERPERLAAAAIRAAR